MRGRKLIQLALGLALLAAPIPAAAGSLSPPTARLDAGKMMGRWYEIARLPNKIQKDCQGGTSDWIRAENGFQVVQTCHKGALSAPATEWRARARMIDPKTNARFKITYFGGVLTLEYWVLESHADEGWVILATPNGRSLWLMSQKPYLPPAARSQAVARIKQLGFDVAALEFPQPARN
ncbi:MAG: lipocalin [Alphaproteobacteria bacterium PA2]|nr:MAG: lipocalin [Alphaproteobacteria bacterium PA2]